MYATGNSEEFNLCVSLTIKLLKFHNKELINACQETLTSLLGSDCTTDIMAAAIFQLLDNDPETLRWSLHNLPELKACSELLQSLIMFAVNKLMEEGFILGKDFSISHKNAVLINKPAQTALMKELIPADRILLKEVLLFGH